jgi:hypothetical protein
MERIRLLILSVLFFPPLASAQTPMLVQHGSSSNVRTTSTMSSPYCYHYGLPEPATAGNAVIVAYTVASSNPTPTITDDAPGGSNSYTLITSYQDATDNQAMNIAAAFGVKAGTRRITICFAGGSNGYWLQPMVSEFANVTAADGVGSGNKGTGTSITAGNLTPTQTGDLVYQVVFNLNITTISGGVSNVGGFTQGSQSNITWTLLSSDIEDGWAGQYGVYNSTAMINPTMSMGTSATWVTAALLLKAGSAGSVPTNMRVLHLQHVNLGTHVQGGGNGGNFPNPTSIAFPSNGNLLVFESGAGFPGCFISTVTDSTGATWQQAGVNQAQNGGAGGTSYIWYSGNATPSNSRMLSIGWTCTTDATVMLYDVINGPNPAVLDAVGGNNGNDTTGVTTATVNYTITPTHAGDLIFTDDIWNSNTAVGLGANSGTWYVDTDRIDGEAISGYSSIDENNGHGHGRSTVANTAITLVWGIQQSGLSVGTFASSAAAFSPGTQPVPVPPTLLPVTVQ